MTAGRRNPYVILGIPFSADEAQARSGFAKASRRLRTDEDAPYTMEDLTWALHQVEQIIAEPSMAFDVYRVPADPTVANVDRLGVFNPQPKPIPRSTSPSTEEERGALRCRAVLGILLGALTANPLTLEISIPYEQEESANG